MRIDRQSNRERRSPRMFREGSRRRATLATAIAGLAALLIASVAPTTAEASPTTTEADSTEVTSHANAAADDGTIGTNMYISYDLFYRGHDRGWVQLKVFPGGRKRITVCDERADPMGPGLQIDPSGPAAPITYFDTNGSNPGCLSHDIGYSVRKWRPVVQQDEGSTLLYTDEWHVDPLPRPDF